MANRIIYRLTSSNIVIEPPVSDSEVTIEMRQNTEDADKQAVVTQNDWDFGAISNPNKPDAVKIINQYIEDGGINEGLLYSVSVDDGNEETQILDAYLLLNAEPVLYSCEIIRNVPSEVRGGIDWFARISTSVSFELLVQEGILDPSVDTINCPYKLSSRPDYKAAAIVSIAAFITINQARDMVKELSNVTAEISSVISAISGILKAVIVVSWLVILIASTVTFIKQISDLIIQPIKYHTCMLWKRQLEAGCEKLGLTLVSTIFEDELIKDVVIMPPKFNVFNDPTVLDTLGFTSPRTDLSTGVYRGSFRDLIDLTKTTFRAEVTLTSDGRLIIEKKDTDNLLPAGRLPNIKRLTHRTNQSELKTTYTLRFIEDENEGNANSNYKGTKTIVTTSLENVTDKSAVVLGGNDPEKEVLINLSRGIRKESFDDIERRLNKLVVDYRAALFAVVITANILITIRNVFVASAQPILAVWKFIGIEPPFEAGFIDFVTIPPIDSIASRLGVLSLPDDSFTDHKVFALDISSNPRNTKLKKDNNTKINSKYFYNTYHSDQSFIPSASRPFGNQKDIFEAIDVPIPLPEIKKMMNNKRIFTFDGQQAELISFLYRPRTGIAERIEYSISKISAPNLKQVINTPDGL